jgi:hypothetical protein
LGSDEAGRERTAVVFDLWGTLVPFPHSAWDNVLAQIASELDADLGEFLAAWHADYANRASATLSRASGGSAGKPGCSLTVRAFALSSR